MELTLTTPALLFPAISLLLLAYTNRFLHLATLIRGMQPHEESPEIRQQIDNLKHRIVLIRRMQEAGGLSFFCCVLAMLFIYLDYFAIANWIFGLSLLLLLTSLLFSVREINISLRALEIHLADLSRSGRASCRERVYAPV